MEGLALAGEVLPAWASRPRIPEHLQFIWTAFARLSTDRQIGMDVGAIMFTSIEKYAERYRVDGVDAFDRFALLIRAMDRDWLSNRPKPGAAGNKD